MTVLQLGMKNDEVKTLQIKLNALGYKVPVNGVYDDTTQHKICVFQKKYKLVTDGITGQNTMSIINQLYNALPKPKQDTPKPTPKYIVPKIKPAPRKVKGKQLSKDDIKYGILHHTAFKGDMTWGQIDKEHKDKFDTDGFGYHFKINKDGTIQAGRPLNSTGGATIGVQCKGLNSISIGIVFDGNFEVEKLTPAQIESGKVLVQWLKYVVYKGKIKFIGHKEAHDINPEATITVCPGKNFPLDMFKKL